MITGLQCEELAGETAFEKCMSLAPDKDNFMLEFRNYMVGGVIVNTPRMFLMAKPIDSSVHPDGQWWTKNPDTWYVRWAAGNGAMKMMMEMGRPLPYVMFRRIKEGFTKPFKRYEWNTIYRRVCAASCA